MSAGKPHVDRALYFKIFVALTVLTVLEVGVVYVPGIGKVALGIALTGMALAKAALVLWFFMHLAIESSVLSLMIVFEHRTYLPMVGVCVALGLLAGRAYARAPRGALAAALLVLVALGSAAAIRNHAWGDGERFWRDAMRKGEVARSVIVFDA